MGTFYRDNVIGGRLRIGKRDSYLELDIDSLISEGLVNYVGDESDSVVIESENANLVNVANTTPGSEAIQVHDGTGADTPTVAEALAIIKSDDESEQSYLFVDDGGEALAMNHQIAGTDELIVVAENGFHKATYTITLADLT